MPSEEILEVWRNATGCVDAPEHYSKSTLEKYLPKFLQQHHFSGIGDKPAARDKALRALWDERGDPIAIVEAFVGAVLAGVKTLPYARVCLKNALGTARVVSENESYAKEAGAAGEQGISPDSPGKGFYEPAAPEIPPQFEHQPSASPQLENGYLRIANEIWGKLISFDLTGAEMRIVMAIIRVTWGWARKEAEVSISDLCQSTNQPHRTVTHSLRYLLLRNVITRHRGGGRGRKSKWAFNKNWKVWKTMQEAAQLLNSATDGTVNDLNCAKGCLSTVQEIAQIQAKDCTVYGCKSLKGQGQLGAKDTFKDKRKKEPPIVPQRDLPPAVPLTAPSLFEIWNAEGGALRKITTYMTQLLKVEELVAFFNVEQNGTGPVQRWTEFVRHAAQTVHEEHRGFIEPVWIAKNLIHVDDLLAGKYSRSFKGESHGSGTRKNRLSDKGNLESFREQSKGRPLIGKRKDPVSDVS